MDNYVYVISSTGKPLMPTKRCGWVRRALNNKRARVVRRDPFTIQLLYESNEYVQNIDLGIDAGSKHIGVSACSNDREFYASEVNIRTDIVDNISTRRELRINRRYRKRRYRKPRFLNRKKPKGWLAPSIRAKINTHLKEVSDICKILPINHIVVETAAFDTQKIKAVLSREDVNLVYRHGEQEGFSNVREYVLWRDNHICQCCKGKSGDKILNVHHIESRMVGGNAPNNLITLCEYCHKKYHAGLINIPQSIKRGRPMRDEAFMGIMRWTLYDKLKEIYPNKVSMTYGYITKKTRIDSGLKKSHAVDARCISGHPLVKPLQYYYLKKKVRCHNRQLHKANKIKGGKRKPNQAAKYVFGYRLFDKVRYLNAVCFIFSRRSSGYFDIRKIDGERIKAGISYKKLHLISRSSSMLLERRVRID